MKLAKDNGFMPVSLGSSVLRVSTAAIAITSYIKLALGACPSNSFSQA
jgi:16S rRNA U1498 N3-methylase RsmE